MASSNNSELISEAKPHTVKKFELIEEYAMPWAQKLLNNDFCEGIIFIDCMCNSGVYHDIDGNIVYGTPVRVAKILTTVADQYPAKQIFAYFNDKSEAKVKLLQETIEGQGFGKRGNLHIQYSHKDGNSLLKDMGKQLNRDNKLHYFLLYDPYDASIDWEALAPFFRFWGEVMINHMGSDPIRAISQVKRPEKKQKYEDTYLIDDFQNLLPYGTNKEAYENRVSQIINQLSNSASKRYFVASFPFFNRSNAWLYDLIHCTGNIEGYKLFKKSAWKTFGDRSTNKKSNVVQGQLTLDLYGLSESGLTTDTDEECLTVADIAKYLQERFAGCKRVPLDDMWKVLDQHPIFPSEGYKIQIKKELREVYGADTSAQSYISFADRS